MLRKPGRRNGGLAERAATRVIVGPVVVELSNTDPQTDPLIGRKLDGRYEVLGRLGEGGVGVVYRGRQTQLGRLVAIKVLQQDAAASPEWRRRFEREARALSVLAHPNVVTVTDSGIDRGVPFLVMELLQGKTLADLIKEKGPLPLWRALDIARQLLRGLAFAHGKGIVHRDLKPANVFLQALPDEADHVRLLDFGMAKFLDGSSQRNLAETQTRAGVVFGTPAYMSPEQAKGGPADARTDVYAAGALLFELLAGRRPFVEETYEGVVMAHLTQPVPSLAKLRSKLTAAPLLQPVIERAMAKKPAARFKDAAAMLAALDAVTDKLPAEAVGGGRAEARRRSTPGALRAAPSGARRGRPAIVLVMLAAVTAGGIYLRSDLAKLVGRVGAAARSAEPLAKPSPPPEPPPSTLHSLPPKPEPPTPPPAEARAAAEDQAQPDQPEQAPEPEQAQPPQPPQSERKPRPRARNPWRGPVPRALRSLRDRVNHGAHLSQKALAPLYEFAHENPADSRPWLVLGHAYAEVDWYSDSVDRYLRADHADSTCRGDPQMLADLLDAAAHPAAGRAAARAIRDIYGAEAIPALDKAMKRAAGDHEATARLTRLRESLPH